MKDRVFLEVPIFLEHASYVVFNGFWNHWPAVGFGSFLCLSFLWRIQDDVTTFLSLILDASHIL